MLTPSIDEEFDSLYESIDHRLIQLTGEETPIVCVLNKPLVMQMADLLNVIVGELNVYISTQRILFGQSNNEKFKIDSLLRIDEAEKSVSLYRKHRDIYLRVLSNYDEFLDTLDPFDRVTAGIHLVGNPLRI